MAKNHSNVEESKDSEHYPLSDVPRGGKGKKGAHAGVLGKQKDRETKEWEQTGWKDSEKEEGRRHKDN